MNRADGAGDLIVTVQIRLPETQSEAAERAVQELENLYAESPRAGLKL